VVEKVEGVFEQAVDVVTPMWTAVAELPLWSAVMESPLALQAAAMYNVKIKPVADDLSIEDWVLVWVAVLPWSIAMITLLRQLFGCLPGREQKSKAVPIAPAEKSLSSKRGSPPTQPQRTPAKGKPPSPSPMARAKTSAAPQSKPKLSDRTRAAKPLSK